jgi:5-methylcytosine-specific restriction endonuclease McrA
MMRPLRVCAYPGCSVLVSSGHCAKHTPKGKTRRTDPKQRQFYSSAAWQRIRATVRREEPSCRLCGAPSTSVDHIDASYTNNRRENLRALCGRCERSRTGKQHKNKQTRDGAPAKVQPDRSWFV